MKELGLVECLRETKGKLTPTFFDVRAGIDYLRDHLFTIAALPNHLIACDTGAHGAIFENNVTADLPIIADISLPIHSETSNL